MPETITIPKEEYLSMKTDIRMLRRTKLYERLLQFEKNIAKAKFTRKDLGF